MSETLSGPKVKSLHIGGTYVTSSSISVPHEGGYVELDAGAEVSVGKVRGDTVYFSLGALDEDFSSLPSLSLGMFDNYFQWVNPWPDMDSGARSDVIELLGIKNGHKK